MGDGAVDRSLCVRFLFVMFELHYVVRLLSVVFGYVLYTLLTTDCLPTWVSLETAWDLDLGWLLRR